MNTGIIASRYAAALLKYSVSNAEEDIVYRQVGTLETAFAKLPELSRLVSAAMMLPDSEKLSLMKSAVEGGDMAKSLDRFLRLVLRNGRMPYIRLILHSYVMQYHRLKGIVTAKLTTCAPSRALEDRLKEIAASRFGEKLEVRTCQDPSLIGGFIFELDGLRVDASVSRQLENIRNVFKVKNRRIV